MTPDQPDLFTRVPTAADVSWLEGLLYDARCWMTAGDIALTTGGRVGDRDIRQLASQNKKIISGQRGYKHIAHATAEECDRAANWLESQAKVMSERACAIRREAHRIFG